MQFSDYAVAARATNVFPAGTVLPLILGLCGESGEVAELIKKNERDHGGIMDAERRDLLKKELGDVLWYLSNIADVCGFSLEEAATANLAKLQDRAARGVIHGMGDNR